MDAEAPIQQAESSGRCPECGQSVSAGDGAAACPHCGFLADGSMLVLHGWASKHLRGGNKVFRIWLSMILFCPMLAVTTRGLLRSYMGLPVPYAGALAITSAVCFRIVWRRRWPLLSANAPTQWQMCLSQKGFAARVGAGPVEWEPWSQVRRVSLRRPRPGLCRVRIVYQEVPESPKRPAVDLVVLCDGEAAGQLRGCIAGWRRGEAATPPTAHSAALMARAAARRARGEGASPLSLEQCPQCAYDLAGLPEKGQCPECGFEYAEESLIVLYGWNGVGPGQASPRRMGLVIVLLMFSGFAAALLAPLLGMRQTYVQWLIIGIVLVPRGVVSHFQRRRYSSSHGVWTFGAADWTKPWQLRLRPEGFSLRVGYGPCGLQAWSEPMCLDVAPVEGNTYRVQITDGAKSEVAVRTLAKMDFDCDAETAKRIVERVGRWRQTGGTPGGAA